MLVSDHTSALPRRPLCCLVCSAFEETQSGTSSPRRPAWSSQLFVLRVDVPVFVPMCSILWLMPLPVNTLSGSRTTESESTFSWGAGKKYRKQNEGRMAPNRARLTAPNRARFGAQLLFHQCRSFVLPFVLCLFLCLLLSLFLSFFVSFFSFFSFVSFSLSLFFVLW